MFQLIVIPLFFTESVTNRETINELTQQLLVIKEELDKPTAHLHNQQQSTRMSH